MRIVSLVPSHTEILFALGLDPFLVGVTEHCDYPPAAASITKIGSFAAPDVDKIMTLRPDIILADPLLHKKYIAVFSAAGCRVHAPQLQTVADVLQFMEDIAHECSAGAAALDTVNNLRSGVDKVRGQAAAGHRLRVFYLMSHDPVITPGPRSVQYDALRTAGAELMPMPGKAFLRLSWEEVAAFNPQVLFACGRRKGEPKRPLCKGCRSPRPLCQRQVDEVINQSPPGLAAVEKGHVYPVSCAMLCRPGPRLIQGMKQIRARLASIC